MKRKYFALISRPIPSGIVGLEPHQGIWNSGMAGGPGTFVIISGPDGDRDIVSSFRVVVARDGANIRIQTLIPTKVPSELQNRAFYLSSVRLYWDNSEGEYTLWSRLKHQHRCNASIWSDNTIEMQVDISRMQHKNSASQAGVFIVISNNFFMIYFIYFIYP